MILLTSREELQHLLQNRKPLIRTQSFFYNLVFFILINLMYRPEKQMKMLESSIHRIVEESILANSKEEFRVALDKAKEAVNKEKSLIRQKEQSGMGESNNDLAFMVHYWCVLFVNKNGFH